MLSNNARLVVDVASDGTPRFRPISRFERFLEPGAILVASLVALLFVINF